MPFKHNAARRHRIPRARYRVTNWPVYEAGLRRRGDLTLWLDEAAVAGWSAPKRSTPGGQPIYSDLAIELVLTLRLVFHLALRQAEAFVGSILRLLGLDLSVPDHSTLSRRGRAFAGRCSRVLPSPGQAETAMGRYKHLIGPRLRARTLSGQQGESRDRRKRAQPDDPDWQTRLRSRLIFRMPKANYERPSIPAPTPLAVTPIERGVRRRR
jgi:hypothetical protein